MRIKGGKKTPDKGIELEGLYANIFKVGYNPSEFVLDFGQYFSEQGKEQFHTRIVTTPEYVKLFFELLQEAINQYKVSIDFQIINFTRPEGGGRISHTSTTDNTVKLFI